MTAEFFVPEWLKARPFLYLVSHMAIMPFIDLYRDRRGMAAARRERRRKGSGSSSR